jgi:hypothetical protein
VSSKHGNPRQSSRLEPIPSYRRGEVMQKLPDLTGLHIPVLVKDQLCHTRSKKHCYIFPDAPWSALAPEHPNVYRLRAVCGGDEKLEFVSHAADYEQKKLRVVPRNFFC